MEYKAQRDVFWRRIYELARHDPRLNLVAADMGAPALDIFRTELASQFIDVGIAEQQGLAVAAGLALGGQKAFFYAIAPFASLRCYEHIRVNLAAMNLPVTIVGVGAGFSYADSGPTHHAVDDLSIMRILPRLEVHTISDPAMARAFADISVASPVPNYVRLDREILPRLYEADADFSSGMEAHGPSGDILLIGMGNMVHTALRVARRAPSPVRVLDLHTLPIRREKFLDLAASARRIVTLEEHNLAGGLGSAVLELLADAGLARPVKRLGLDCREGYCYRYGGRPALQALCGLDEDSVIKSLAALS